MNKHKYMLVYWWGYHNNKDDRPFVEWVDEKADEFFTENNGWDIEDIEDIKELSVGDDHEIWGAASTSKLTIYCYA
jgi:hypothetical protein